jgi:hypothetical protein
MIRSLWPDVPCLVVIRDPAEIMVSQIASPASWTAFKVRPRLACDIFGWVISDHSVIEMPTEEYFARVIGQLCETAARMIDEKSRVVFYEDINVARIVDIARFFGIGLSPGECERIEQVLSVYSKDPAGVEKYKDDREKKLLAMTDSIRKCADKWARPAFERLKKLERW